MRGDNAARRAEDIGGQELSYAEVKAIASGNPAVLTLAEADAELQRLSVLKKNHADEQYLARRNLRELPATIGKLSERLSNLTADMATASTHARDPITIGNRTASREDVRELLTERLDSLPKNVRETRRFPLGLYRGLSFGLILHPQFAPEVYLEGATTRQDTLSREHHGPRAVLNALERLSDSYGTTCTSVRQDLTIADAQLRDYQARLGTSVPHDSYFSKLTALRDQLKVRLSEKPPEPGEGREFSVSEIVEQIKRLKASHTIETTPERVANHHAKAEEPVTARIRRRTEVTAAKVFIEPYSSPAAHYVEAQAG